MANPVTVARLNRLWPAIVHSITLPKAESHEYLRGVMAEYPSALSFVWHAANAAGRNIYGDEYWSKCPGAQGYDAWKVRVITKPYEFAAKAAIALAVGHPRDMEIKLK